MSIWHNIRKVCENLKYVAIKFAQANLQKCIIWPKKMGREAMNGNKLVLKLEFGQGN
jgi:hypothetical protein